MIKLIGDILGYGFYVFLILVGGLFSLAYFFTGDFGFHFFLYLLLYHVGGLGIGAKLRRRQDLKEAQELLEEVREQTRKTLEEMREGMRKLRP